MHQHTDTEDVLKAKEAFKACAQERGVTIKHYHCDNGIFRSRDFVHHAHRKKQTVTFCGVDAHHQNGIAEHRIRQLSDSARTQLLHAMTHNPNQVTAQLWPHALKHANHLFNALPRTGNDFSPEQLFSGSKADPQIGEIHPFGCPACVLKSKLAHQAKQRRWQSRARLGAYLGPSPHHSSTVGLILNKDAGYISPQYHCTCDDYFETPKLEGNASSHWQTLARIQEQDFCDKDFDTHC